MSEQRRDSVSNNEQTGKAEESDDEEDFSGIIFFQKTFPHHICIVTLISTTWFSRIGGA